jgi:hypothetical protein
VAIRARVTSQYLDAQVHAEGEHAEGEHAEGEQGALPKEAPPPEG